MNFEKIYGKMGKDFIEGHHSVPLNQYKVSLVKALDIKLTFTNKFLKEVKQI